MSLEQFLKVGFLIIGGMPECVSSWIKYKDPARVAQIQKELINLHVSENQPEYAVRFSKRGYRKDGYITNMPLYLARKMKKLV